MTQHDKRMSPPTHFLKPGRTTLLASVAGLGIAALVSGTSVYHPSPLTWISPAVAAETTVQPSGFADLVARVKPAVISVRISFNDSAQVSSFNQNGDHAMPFRQGSPLDRFLQQFGFQDIPNGVQRLPPPARARASSSPPAAML
jgi:serine protease Do